MNAQDKFITDSNNKQMQKFCPMINDKCRQDCECFVEAKVNVKVAYCNNVLFDREIIMDLSSAINN